MTTAPSPASAKTLWQPTESQCQASNLAAYMAWLKEHREVSAPDYDALWKWSVSEPGAFWSSLSEYFGVRQFEPAKGATTTDDQGRTQWFPGAKINYAEQALRHTDGPAILYKGESGEAEMERREVPRAELRRQVAWVRARLEALGVGPGDRVAAYLPNLPETVVAFLATASLGAIWSNCPLEAGSRTVLERFSQINPKILFAAEAYWYGGKRHERREPLAEIVAGLPDLQHLVMLPLAGEAMPPVVEGPSVHRWADWIGEGEGPELRFEPVAFDHPLWILYSSGTTGQPKAIVHGHGGMLLEHLKCLHLHLDLKPGDRFFWYTSSGWMMWNFLVSGLLLPGVEIVLYNGSPKLPDFSALWRFVEEEGIDYFGTSAPFLLACQKAGLEPGKDFSFPKLRGIGSTGAPLPAEGFEWVYDHVKRDVLLGSVSGGTDVCTAFVLSNPLAPVEAGRIQCAGLGMHIEAWDDAGQPVYGEVGELVLRSPAPCMPVCFWNDPDGERLNNSYYSKYPGTWNHGDWIEIARPGGPCTIHGRSDATLNRGGIRMGTADFYAVVEAMPEVADSLVIDAGGLGKDDALLLFLVLNEGAELSEDFLQRLRQQLRSQISPKHVPDAVHQVSAVPRTLNGKKLEVPIKRILQGAEPDKCINRGTVLNPECLRQYFAFAIQFNT